MIVVLDGNDGFTLPAAEPVELPEGEGALSQFPPCLEKSPNWVP